MDKVFREKDLHAITHKEFDEFIKGKGFKGGNNYRVRDFKGNVWIQTYDYWISSTISSDGTEPTRFDSMSKASTSTGIPYVTLLYAKRNSRNRVRSNGKEYTIIYHWLKCLTVISKTKLMNLTQE